MCLKRQNLVQHDTFIKLRGLPFSCKAEDIEQFFEGRFWAFPTCFTVHVAQAWLSSLRIEEEKKSIKVDCWGLFEGGCEMTWILNGPGWLKRSNSFTNTKKVYRWFAILSLNGFLMIFYTLFNAIVLNVLAWHFLAGFSLAIEEMQSKRFLRLVGGFSPWTKQFFLLSIWWVNEICYR